MIDRGVWYGLEFDAVLFSAMGLLYYIYYRLRPKRQTRTPAISGEMIRLKARLRRLVRPTLLLVPAKEPGFSKIGGSPELPAGQKWPVVSDEPRSFLAQIDLETLAPHAVIDWLPKAGRFYAFYDCEGHGRADVVRIVYSLEPAGAPVAAPAGVRFQFGERRVAFMVFTSAPSLDWLGLDVADLDLDEDEFEQLEAIGDAPPPDELQHRIGGYPNEIQPEVMPLSCEHLARGLPDPVWGEDIPPAIARAAKEWRLLLQIDSDPALKMNFGDGGRLYVFIRERHARAGNFSKTVAMWQTY